MNTIATATPSTENEVELLRMMIDHSNEAILVINTENLIITELNLNACNMLGYLREELLGRGLPSIECSLLDVFFWEELAQEPLFQGARIAQTEWMRSNGSSFHIEKRVFSHAENGRTYWVVYSEDLTRRKELERQQLQLVSQLQSSLESTAEGILSVDVNGNVVNVNRRFTNMWNLPDAALLRHTEEDMWIFIFSSLIDSRSFIASLGFVRVEPHVETEELLALRDGRYFICVSKPEFLRDSLIGRVFSVRDITAMKKIETDLLTARDIAEKASQDKTRMLDALKLSESRLRRLVNSNLIGIMRGDTSGNIFEANDVLLGLLGVTREEFEQRGMNWFPLTSPSNHTRYQDALIEMKKEGQSSSFEVELLPKAKTPIPAMVGFAQLEGSTTEWVGFVLDLTKQRESDRIKSDFISLVSHELRTPLTSIHGSLGLLENGVCGEIPPTAMNLVKIAAKNSKRLGLLVNDLLDMEKLAAGKMTLQIERFDLIALARQALEANTAYAQTLNVKFKFDHFPAEAWCMGDNNRLMQVFANLLSNASKFSKEGGYVELKVLEQGQKFRVEVTDQGAGIPLEFRDHIFKKFAQADGGDTRRQGGTGLGLNISQSLVEKMGGEIGFNSELGVGTTFWFTVVSDAGSSPERVEDAGRKTVGTLL